MAVGAAGVRLPRLERDAPATRRRSRPERAELRASLARAPAPLALRRGRQSGALDVLGGHLVGRGRLVDRQWHSGFDRREVVGRVRLLGGQAVLGVRGVAVGRRGGNLRVAAAGAVARDRGGLGGLAADGGRCRHRGHHRGLDGRRELRVCGLAVGLVGDVEARHGRAARPARLEMLFEPVEVGEGDAAIGARREQPGHARAGLGRVRRRVAGRRMAGRADQERLGIDVLEVAREDDARAEAAERLDRGGRRALAATRDDLAVREHRGATDVTQACERVRIAVAHAGRSHGSCTHAPQATASGRRSMPGSGRLGLLHAGFRRAGAARGARAAGAGARAPLQSPPMDPGAESR